jgi:phage/plasmid-like protein (TIGR03299 family)
MSANIDTMMFLGSTPWHGLGTKISDGYIPVQEAMSLAGLNWTVDLEDCFLADGTAVPKTKISRRSSDGKILGTVGDRYTVLQNQDAFKWFEPFIESKQAHFETAGSLRDGKIVWVLAKTNIETTEITKGDAVDSYILLSHSHDGSLSIRSGFTPIRVVCNNTLNLALNSSSSKLLKLKHTRNAVLNLEVVREVMDVAKQEFIATAEQYRFLASRAISKADLNKYINLVLAKEDVDAPEVRAKRVEEIECLFETGKGHELAGNTYWGAYNAITEFNSWNRGRTQDARLRSLWFGDNGTQNQKALELAVSLSKQ